MANTARPRAWAVEDFLAFEAGELERYEFVGGVVRRAPKPAGQIVEPPDDEVVLDAIDARLSLEAIYENSGRWGACPSWLVYTKS